MQKTFVDKKNVKAFENKPKDILIVGKAEQLPIPNGVVTHNSRLVANGCSGQTVDNDGSGSENGYSTPKKRQGRCSSQDLDLLQDRVMQLEAVALAVAKDQADLKSELLLQPEGIQIAYTKAAWRNESGSGESVRGKPASTELQRKNSEGKPILSKKVDERLKSKPVTASSAASKDDSWTLFKPPPVFPVDNSSAKIVPKISYASKVKENLNKAAQTQSVFLCSSSTVEAPGQTSSRLTHVPMSAMKSVTSTSFSNGPILAGSDGTSYTTGNQPLPASTASTVLPSQLEVVSSDPSKTVVVVEQKPNLFIYPSIMQTGLVGMTPADHCGHTNQQSLGEIFQNQWGLSFINEPSAGPESNTVQAPEELDLTFQEEYADLLSHSAEKVSPEGERAVFPKAYELDKRTSPTVLSSLLKSGVTSLGAVLAHEPRHIGELQKADSGSQDVLEFLSKDYEIDSLRASPTNILLTSAKEQHCPEILEKKHSWGSFDQRAAIIYHTREMETIWHLQKQDPKRIIIYNEAMDHAAH
ncbi:FMR1-interacting protein NUFIP2 isoform X2 [Ambystoma mexicanum]